MSYTHSTQTITNVTNYTVPYFNYLIGNYGYKDKTLQMSNNIILIIIDV